VIDEGYIKFHIEWEPSGALELPEIDELDRWRTPLRDAGLVGHYDDQGIGYGNLSIRLDRNRGFVISGTQTGHIERTDGRHYALVTAVDIGTNLVVCRGPVKASSESLTHAAIYSADPAVGAVVHVHQPQLWAALRGVLPTTDPAVAYGTPAMALELARICAQPEFRGCRIAVMAGHEAGLVSVGSSLEDAASRMLALDRDGALPPDGGGRASGRWRQ